jgi:hypothetical protein
MRILSTFTLVAGFHLLQGQSTKILRQAQVQSCETIKEIPSATGKEIRVDKKEFYDKQGRIKELIRFGKSGEVEKHIVYYHSASSDWKAEVELKPGKKTMKDSLIEKRGSSGEWERSERFGKDGKLKYYEIHSWENGLKMKTTRHSPTHSILFTKTFKYRFQ